MTAIETVANRMDFLPLHKRMQWYIDNNILSCCNSLVMRGLDVLDYKTYGYMDLATRRPLLDNAIFRMYSNTKIVTSVAAMILFEEGRFGLDDPLAEYLPKFANARVFKPDAATVDDTVLARSPITMRQILSHSAGLSYGFIEPQSIVDRTYNEQGINLSSDSGDTLEALCDRLATLPLAFEPGTAWRYSLATDVASRAVEVLSGMRFDHFLKQRIFDPLDMHDTGFHVPAEKRERFTTMYAPQNPLDPMQAGLTKADDPDDGRYTRAPTLLSGGGGLVSTVSDYLSFIRMIVNDGEWQGARILKASTLATMRTNQLAPGITLNIPMWPMPKTVFGLGFGIRSGAEPEETNAVIDEYFWGGMAGTHSWMSPRANLTGMCMTQRMPGFWHPFSHDFRRLAYQATG